MSLPTTWGGWAARVSLIVREGKKLIGEPRLPIQIGEIAHHITREFFPDEPIVEIIGRDFGGEFEGALAANDDGHWAIFFDRGQRSKGRVNFTLAHELGHYFIHRHAQRKFMCSRSDMQIYDSAYGLMEAEANNFASFVLMPPDDFREQTSAWKRPTLDQFEALRHRYAVSLTAVVLKWLQNTNDRAMLVVSKDGFVDWARSSPRLFSSGVYIGARKITTPLPARSIAALGPRIGISAMRHPAGVWSATEPVFESVIFAESYGFAISLLNFPTHGGKQRFEPEEPELLDRFDAFQLR